MATASNNVQCLIRHAETTKKSNFQTSREGIRDDARKEALAIKAWTAVLSDKTDNNNKIKEMGDDPEMSDDMEVTPDSFVMQRNVFAMIVDKMKRATATMSTRFITSTFKPYNM